MWLLKLRIKHNCTIGNRCEKFGVTSYSIPLGNWHDGKYNYTAERHTLEGNPKDVSRFLEDITKDRRIMNVEVSGNTLFFIGKNSEKIPSSFYNQKMFFTRPVLVDNQGYEYWEVASHDRKILAEYLDNVRRQDYYTCELLIFKNVKLKNIYFPSIEPELTEKQRQAFRLAVDEGYYDIPKRADLKKLSKIMKISLATYQEHLKRAEAKIVPKMKF